MKLVKGNTSDQSRKRHDEADENRLSLSYNDLRKSFEYHLELEDDVPVAFVLGCLLAHRREGEPVWGHLEAGSSSAKTEILRSLSQVSEPRCLFVSQLTNKTLTSGYRDHRNHSLLNEETTDLVLIFKDFTSITSLRSDQQTQVLAQLREIYDGMFDSYYGSGVRTNWRGRLTVITGATPVLEHFRSVNAFLGERFLTCRISSDNDRHRRRAVQKAIRRGESTREMREELAEAVARFVTSHRPRDQELTRSDQRQLARIADIVTKVRSPVLRDRWRREIIDVPEPEAPMRMGKQLASLFLALQDLGSAFPCSRAMEIIRRVARDSVPILRARLLQQLADGDWQTSTELAKKLHRPPMTVSRALEDLFYLKVLHREMCRRKNKPVRWAISEEQIDDVQLIVE